MPKTVTKTAITRTAYGQELAQPLDFIYDYVELVEGDDIPAEEMLDEKGLRTYVNQQRNALARSSAQNKAFADAGIQKPTNEDPATALKNMIRLVMQANKVSEATAEQIARGVLNTPSSVVI